MGKHVDEVYKELVFNILEEGVIKGDRTGTGTVNTFGQQLKIDMSERFPLLTTKKVFWRGVVAETVMFLKGETNLKFLLDEDVDIWTRDAYKQFLKRDSGITNITLEEFREKAKEEGYLMGPIYGKNWVDFNGSGVNQLDNIINEIKTNPNSRRLKVYTANPAQAHLQALPPCHDAFQFDIHDGVISCLFQMRSSDTFLGLPMNIASYALITHIVAEMTNLKTGQLIAQLGSSHIYSNHLDALEEQMQRESLINNQCKVVFSERVKSLNTISDIEISDITLDGYESHGLIKAPQAF